MDTNFHEYEAASPQILKRGASRCLTSAHFEPICDPMAGLSKTELFRARIDRGRKERTEKILKRFGLSPGEAVNVFFAKIEEVGGLPFDLRPEPDETRELMDTPAFLRHLARMKAGKVRYTTAKNLPE